MCGNVRFICLFVYLPRTYLLHVTIKITRLTLHGGWASHLKTNGSNTQRYVCLSVHILSIYQRNSVEEVDYIFSKKNCCFFVLLQKQKIKLNLWEARTRNIYFSQLRTFIMIPLIPCERSDFSHSTQT